MALEIIAADLVATLCCLTGNPILSLDIKRQKFTWFFEGNHNAIADGVLNRFYPEEIQAAVEQVLLFSRVLVENRGLL